MIFLSWNVWELKDSIRKYLVRGELANVAHLHGDFDFIFLQEVKNGNLIL